MPDVPKTDKACLAQGTRETKAYLLLWRSSLIRYVMYDSSHPIAWSTRLTVHFHRERLFMIHNQLRYGIPGSGSDTEMDHFHNLTS